jgi:hypothetical protein
MVGKLLGIATVPIMTWVSGKLWIDNLHAGLAVLLVALALMTNRFRYAQFLYRFSCSIMSTVVS